MMFYTTGQFYRSKAWEDTRRSLMLERRDSKGDIICSVCGKPITQAYDCIVHHLVPLTENNLNDYTVSLNPDNLVLVHHSCHNELHNRFGHYDRHIYVVYGSPCAGKAEYVKANALPDDLIIDLDELYKAINTSRSNRVYVNAVALRDALVDMVKTRQGKWVNAWLVGNVFAGCYMWSERDRARLADMLDAELVYIDTPQEVCLARAEARGGDFWTIVADWWKKFQTPPTL